MRKRIAKRGDGFLMFLMLIFAYQVQASENIGKRNVPEKQQVEITGIVTSSANNMPIPGVSVVEKGTNNGTVTDFEGNYSLSVSKSNATLVYSYVGFKTQEVQVDGKSSIDVSLANEGCTTNFRLCCILA